MQVIHTFTATIHVGLKIRRTGEIQSLDKAKKICQNFVNEMGECVSFTPTEYIYTNGGEPGVIVQFIQYPRFPKPEKEIIDRANRLAELLMKGLSQLKVCVVFPNETIMLENIKEENLNLLHNQPNHENKTN